MKKLLNKKGFTIVELVIVIAVIGILAAVLIPTFSNVIDSAKESAALQEAKNEINAYNSFMASQGVVLGDGAVLKVGEGDDATWFVYYNNQLKKIDFANEVKLGKDIAVTPSISINKIPTATNKCIFMEEKDFTNDERTEATNKGVSIAEGAKGQIYLFYSDINEVTFTDGSDNCTIYAGVTLKAYSKIISTTVFDNAGASNANGNIYFVGKVSFANKPA